MIVLVSSSREHDLAVMTEGYLDSLGAKIVMVTAARDAVKLLRSRPEISGVVVIGEAALEAGEILGWLRFCKPHLPCCVLGTERRHLTACATASGHFLMREGSSLEVERLATFLRDRLNH
jgi:hypothetical protein